MRRKVNCNKKNRIRISPSCASIVGQDIIWWWQQHLIETATWPGASPSSSLRGESIVGRTSLDWQADLAETPLQRRVWLNRRSLWSRLRNKLKDWGRFRISFFDSCRDRVHGNSLKCFAGSIESETTWFYVLITSSFHHIISFPSTRHWPPRIAAWGEIFLESLFRQKTI